VLLGEHGADEPIEGAILDASRNVGSFARLTAMRGNVANRVAEATAAMATERC
jgi:hypothetical protein